MKQDGPAEPRAALAAADTAAAPQPATNGTQEQRLLRCPKEMLHGPCGGVEGNDCEVPGYACPWGTAFVKAKAQGKTTDHLVARLAKPPTRYGAAEAPAEPVSASHLERVLRAGQFAVTAELGPPKHADAAVIRRKAEILRGACDAINITDNQIAIVRMSPIAVGAILISLGLEPVVQFTCRDRNRLALQSDLLGAAALGIRTILALTGDYQTFGNHPEAKGVWDLDSVQLVQLAKRMRDAQEFANGESLTGAAPGFFIGAVENPCGDPHEFRAPRLAKKVQAGADFCQTQAIYDVSRFAAWMQQARDLGLSERCAILAGVTPLRSARGARHINENVPGLHVPEPIIQRLDQARTRQGRQREGIRIAVETIQQLRDVPGVAGVHLMPVHWERSVPLIAGDAGLLPRPPVAV